MAGAGESGQPLKLSTAGGWDPSEYQTEAKCLSCKGDLEPCGLEASWCSAHRMEGGMGCGRAGGASRKQRS